MSKKNLAVLVCYYPNYVLDAAFWISKILQKLGLPYEIIIVANNNKAYQAAQNLQDASITLLEGSNVGWEFSAWDEGWSYVRDSSEFNKVIFVNDTFCQHWPFSWINVCFISRAINRLQPKQIVGDLKKFKNTEKLLGTEANRWMASYLFSCHVQDIDYLLPFDKVNESNWQSLIKIEHQQISLDSSSAGMGKHLQDYMFPQSAKKGWYNSKASNELKRLKLVAIINEISLSAVAEKRGGILVSFHPYRWMRSLNRLRRRWHSFKAKG